MPIPPPSSKAQSETSDCAPKKSKAKTVAEFLEPSLEHWQGYTESFEQQDKELKGREAKEAVQSSIDPFKNARQHCLSACLSHLATLRPVLSFLSFLAPPCPPAGLTCCDSVAKLSLVSGVACLPSCFPAGLGCCDCLRA